MVIEKLKEYYKPSKAKIIATLVILIIPCLFGSIVLLKDNPLANPLVSFYMGLFVLPIIYFGTFIFHGGCYPDSHAACGFYHMVFALILYYFIAYSIGCLLFSVVDRLFKNKQLIALYYFLQQLVILSLLISNY